MATPAIPGDDQLNALIYTRFALVGIDLSTIPDETDPATGTPGREIVMETLRTFLAGPLVGGVRRGGVVGAVTAWRPHPDPATAFDLALPVSYPVRDR